MKLFYWMTCPQACKVLAFLEEINLKQQVELFAKHPWEKNTIISKMNPLIQIPVLETDEGLHLYDSNVICEFLDTLHKKPKLYPEKGDQRWKALRLQTIANGIMDAAILRFLEEQARHEFERSDTWVQRQNLKIILALDFLEVEFSKLKSQEPFHIGYIGAFIALSYLDLRFGFENWREKRPYLKEWFDMVCDRPSLKNNRPRDIDPLPNPEDMDHLT